MFEAEYKEATEHTVDKIVGIAGWKFVDDITREVGPLYLIPEVRGKEYLVEGYGMCKLFSLLYRLISETVKRIDGVSTVCAVIAQVEARKASRHLAEKDGFVLVSQSLVDVNGSEVIVDRLEKKV